MNRWLRRTAVSAWFVLLGTAVTIPSASADVITITSGFVTVNVTAGDAGSIPSVFGEATLIGGGFRLDNFRFGFDAGPQTGLSACIFNRCSGTESVTLGLPLIGQASLTVGSVTHPSVFNPAGIVILNTPVTLPRGRFVLDSARPATFFSFADPSRPAVLGPVFFTGQGTFSLSSLDFDTSGVPTGVRARYDFEPVAPVPEPGTLLLFATGIAAASRRAWKSRATAPDRSSPCA